MIEVGKVEGDDLRRAMEALIEHATLKDEPGAWIAEAAEQVLADLD